MIFILISSFLRVTEGSSEDIVHFYTKYLKKIAQIKLKKFFK